MPECGLQVSGFLHWASLASWRPVFLKHLLDGDAASNTLGWRWVAGIQTMGKCYLARAENISKFTGERFNNARLNERALPLVDEKVHVVQPIDYEISTKQKFETLLIMDSNLNMLTRNETKNYKKIYVMSLANASRQIEISQSVVEFKQNLIKSAAQKHPHCEVLDAGKPHKYWAKCPGAMFVTRLLEKTWIFYIGLMMCGILTLISLGIMKTYSAGNLPPRVFSTSKKYSRFN